MEMDDVSFILFMDIFIEGVSIYVSISMLESGVISPEREYSQSRVSDRTPVGFLSCLSS